MSKRQKITSYLTKNYDVWADRSLLQTWSSFLDQPQMTALSKDKKKLIFKEQAIQYLSKLHPFRTSKDPAFRIKLKELAQRIPNERILLQTSKLDDLFPLIFFRVYIDNVNIYRDFDSRYPHHIRTPQRIQGFLQRDLHWGEKQIAASFLTNKIQIHFPSSLDDSLITFSFQFTSKSAFKASLKHDKNNILSINSPMSETCDMETKYAILYHLLTTFHYDRPTLMRFIENQILNYQYLVPNYIIQIHDYLSSPDRLSELHSSCSERLSSLLSHTSTESFLFHNLLSWPFHLRN